METTMEVVGAPPTVGSLEELKAQLPELVQELRKAAEQVIREVGGTMTLRSGQAISDDLYRSAWTSEDVRRLREGVEALTAAAWRTEGITGKTLGDPLYKLPVAAMALRALEADPMGEVDPIGAPLYNTIDFTMELTLECLKRAMELES